MTVEEMKAVDVRTVDPDSLVDITQITIDKSLSEKERKLEYIRQIKNLYCFRVGNIVVKCSYSEDGVTLNERFEQLVMSV